MTVNYFKYLLHQTMSEWCYPPFCKTVETLLYLHPRLSWLSEGSMEGAGGINFPTSCFIFKHLTKALKICPKIQISPNSFDFLLPNVYPFRKMFTSLSHIFCVRASRLNSVPDGCKEARSVSDVIDDHSTQGRTKRRKEKKMHYPCFLGDFLQVWF